MSGGMRSWQGGGGALWREIVCITGVGYDLEHGTTCEDKKDLAGLVLCVILYYFILFTQYRAEEPLKVEGYWAGDFVKV